MKLLAVAALVASQSLRADQGNSDCRIWDCTPAAWMKSQSLRADQGNSDRDYRRTTARLGRQGWSQSLRADQGNSDFPMSPTGSCSRSQVAIPPC